MLESAYTLYKSFIEAGDLDGLRPFIRPGSWVVDVGAHVGFFAVRFGKWVSEGGGVIAIEPEERNFLQLERTIKRLGLENVFPVQMAAADVTGQGQLRINKYHFGDHRLEEGGGVDIPVTTVDDLVAGKGRPNVSLIKIDVQGCEARVLEGARRTIEEFRPAMFIEFDDELLLRQGSSVEAMCALITGLGYRMYQLGSKIKPMPAEEIIKMVVRKGYHDFLCLPIESGNYAP